MPVSRRPTRSAACWSSHACLPRRTASTSGARRTGRPAPSGGSCPATTPDAPRGGTGTTRRPLCWRWTSCSRRRRTRRLATPGRSSAPIPGVRPPRPARRRLFAEVPASSLITRANFARSNLIVNVGPNGVFDVTVSYTDLARSCLCTQVARSGFDQGSGNGAFFASGARTAVRPLLRVQVRAHPPPEKATRIAKSVCLKHRVRGDVGHLNQLAEVASLVPRVF